MTVIDRQRFSHAFFSVWFVFVLVGRFSQVHWWVSACFILDFSDVTIGYYAAAGGVRFASLLYPGVTHRKS